MTKIFNFALKIKGVVGRVAHAKSSDPATPQNLERALDSPIGLLKLKFVKSTVFKIIEGGQLNPPSCRCGRKKYLRTGRVKGSI